MSIGNWSSRRPSATSSAARPMALASASGSRPRPALASAADALTRPSARMKPRGIGRPEMGKFCTARWVCAPHRASAGTCSSPMLSCSIRKDPDIAVSIGAWGNDASPQDTPAPASHRGRAWNARMQDCRQTTPQSMSEATLLALSPLDGRYAAKADALRPIFSEYGLIRARVRVEVEWLLALAAEPGIAELAAFDEVARDRLRALVDGFTIAD